MGLQAPAVTVDLHLTNGLSSFTLVGLANVEVKEARDRVRSALQNAGLEFPHIKRITVNLASADPPKDSGRFDLTIAMGKLAASGQADEAQLAGFEFAGELSLSGELHPVRGALAMSLALRQLKVRTKLVRSSSSADEAALVHDAHIYRARHLLDVVQQFLPGESTEAIRLRSSAARERALARQGCTNQALQGQAIDAHMGLDSTAITFLNKVATQLGWSGRSTHRTLKVARTIADLAGSASTQTAHVAEAVQYRRALQAT